ncbi:MAG: CBS domain-containing protein [Pseudomonadales bacterium]
MSFQLSLSTESVTAAYLDEPLFVAPDAALSEVLHLLRAQNTGQVLVCEDMTSGKGRLIGIFTERDALKLMAAQEDLDQPVSQVMSRDPVSLEENASVAEAIKTMSQGGYRQLPVIGHDGTPTGMATVYGVVHYLVDHFPQTIYTLPPEPGSVPSEREGA